MEGSVDIRTTRPNYILQDFSGTPHLTIFGAPKYAYWWFNTKKCFRGRQFLCPHPSGSDRRRRDWSDRLRRLTAVPFFVHSSALLICLFWLMYFCLLKGRRDGWLLLKKLATHGYKIWSHKAAVFCQLQPSSRKRRVISWKRPKSVYLLTWAGWIQNGDRIFVKAGPMLHILRFLVYQNTELFSTYLLLRPSVIGVTAQISSMIWWFRRWKPYIFWMHII